MSGPTRFSSPIRYTNVAAIRIRPARLTGRMDDTRRWLRWSRGRASSRTLSIAATVVFVLLGALNLLAYRSLGQGLASADETRRAYRVLTLAQETLQSLERMESVYREFLVTGQEAALSSYGATSVSYRASLRMLQALASDADEVRLWKRVEERADAWEREAIRPGILMRRAVSEGREPFEHLALYESTGNSARYFSEIRQLLADATEARQALVGDRVGNDGERFAQVRATTLWGTIILVALAILITISSARLTRALGQLERADGALAESDARLRLVVEAVREVLFRTDADGRWELLSPGWEQLTGVPVRSVIGERFERWVHADERERVLASFAEFRHSLALEHRDEFRIVLASGEERWVNVHARAERGEGGYMIGVVGTLIDVTERRALEARLRQAYKMEAMGQLAGGVAHDFNNILTVILSCTELALMEVEESVEDARNDLREIRQAARRAAALTRQLLAFSRRQPRTPQVVEVSARLRECESLLTRLLPPTITLVFALDEHPASISIDPSELEQIALNLVVNARDAMPDGGQIVVETRVAAGRVVLKVSDEGIGMDAATQQRIFEPFFTTKPVGKGTGLGLATVYGIVKSAGGAIDVVSAPGAGTTFSLDFDLVASMHVTGELPVVPHLAADAGTILLVDDENAVRTAAARTLRRYGFEVLEARHGSDALRVLETSRHVRLVVTDILMPEMDGRALAREVRRRHPRLPVIYISGYGGDGGNGGEEEHVPVLEKPFTSTALVNHVRAALAD